MLSYTVDGELPGSVQYRSAQAGVPKVFQSITLQEKHRGETSYEAFGKLQNYVWTYPHDSWMVILGTSGSGKTLSACGVLNEIIRYKADEIPIIPQYMNLNTDFPEMLDARHFRKYEKYQGMLTSYLHCDILVVDDLLQVPGAPWAKETLFRIYEYRYAEGLPTITTVNLVVEPDKSFSREPVVKAFDEPFSRRLFRVAESYIITP